jgi:putative membrane protein
MQAYDHAMYFHHYGHTGLFAVLFLLFWLLVLVGIGWLVVSLVTGRLTRAPKVGGTSTAVETLDLRYARGEIGRDDYLQARTDLGHPAKPT